MRSVKSADTTPELIVRRLVHAMGGRFRLHVADLPGRPDLVFPGRRKVIFVHGCFWHRHACRSGRSTPASRAEYWKSKFERNVRRDRSNQRRLRRMGWGVMVVWECQTRPRVVAKLERRLAKFLED
ncbi:MAG: very short patch repair endonuclease [Planctomycetota bacterium]